MCVCVYVHTYVVYVYVVYAYVGIWTLTCQRKTPLYCSVPYRLETRSLTKLEACHFGEAGWLVSLQEPVSTPVMLQL